MEEVELYGTAGRQYVRRGYRAAGYGSRWREAAWQAAIGLLVVEEDTQLALRQLGSEERKSSRLHKARIGRQGWQGVGSGNRSQNGTVE